MYLEHFALTELPFSLTPDTAFFMNRAGYQDALNVLLVALRSGEGFVKVTGEVGTGKTILCRTLLKQLGDDYATAYIPNPYLKPTTLLLSIADELGVRYDAGIGQHAFMKRITQALLEIHASGRRVVVCLDEVQAMPVETLETLRLLTNLETEKRKLLQVVLFGQPELDALLAQPSVRQLRQRITFAYRIEPMNRLAFAHYLRHRLAVAGYDGPGLLAASAIEALYQGSGGIPRLANILAHKSLMVAYGRGDRTVTRVHVRLAVRDTGDARRWEERGARPARTRVLRWLLGSFGALAGIALLALLASPSDVLALLP
ncbi:MAG: AAA family ATPase [Gammaproteobacteria bacterium]|nr:AAA family ATPase [Gammaproteobacteria bacterium]